MRVWENALQLYAESEGGVIRNGLLHFTCGEYTHSFITIGLYSLYVMRGRTRRMARNNAVNNDAEQKAQLTRKGHGRFDVTTDHIGGIDSVEAREFVSEHADEIESVIDALAVHERGPDVGYISVVDGKPTDWTVYAQWQH